MEKPQEGIDSGELYLHVNTLAGAFNLSDELLAWKFDRDYIERIAHSERNFDGGLETYPPCRTAGACRIWSGRSTVRWRPRSWATV